MIDNKTQQQKLKRYYVNMVAFLLSLGLLLFTVVDIRRGFLFSGYFKVGAPGVLLNLDWRHLPLLLAGALGTWLAYRYMAKAENHLKGKQANLKRLSTVMVAVIAVFLVIDLFIYRGVPASRFLAAGKMGLGSGPMGLGRGIPVANFPEWLQPLGDGINYMLVVWHATTLGLLLGGLFLVAGTGLVAKLKGSGFGAHLTGTAISLTQPFCSCCAAPIGSALYRKGASLGPVLAFTVSSPMLNITSLILASALLPTDFALLRIAGGVVIGVFITYFVARISAGLVEKEEPRSKQSKLVVWSSRFLAGYTRLFHFETLFSEDALDSPSALVSNWLGMTWRLARVMVPVLLAGAVLAVYIVRAMPDTGNNFLGVTVTAVFGSLLMVPTWTEIPFAVALINKGLPGIAATALLTLPAVSLPCLAIIAGAVRSVKVAIILGLAVALTGILAGLIFL